MSNTLGRIYRVTSFGESHGEAVGGVIDGCPAGVALDVDFVQAELNRRRPGQSQLTTQRREADKVEFLSGVFEGRTTGAPIGFIVRNEQQRSSDYEHLKHLYRPSHADYTYQMKYGIRDYRGGGRASARETIVRVVAGAVAKLVMRSQGIVATAYTSQIGDVVLPKSNLTHEALVLAEQNEVRCPDAQVAEAMKQTIQQAKAEGDSVGGVVTCVVRNVPVGLGEPVFDKLSARLAYAMLSINAAKGFEYGLGFEAARQRGSEHNDAFTMRSGQVHTLSNNSGGIQGGMSNGEDIYFRVAFKPTPTISVAQTTVLSSGEATELKAHGRHDPCVVPRAVPVVEAMAAITVLDFLLLHAKDAFNG